MALRVNPATGQLEDDGQGTPAGAAPIVIAQNGPEIPGPEALPPPAETFPEGHFSGTRKGSPAPPPGTRAPAQGPMVTDYSGGLQTSVPLGTGEPVVKDSSTDKRSERFKTQTVEEKQALADADRATEQEIEAARQKAAIDVEKAKIEERAAQEKEAFSRQRQLEQQALLARKEKAYAVADADVAARYDEYKRAAANPAADFWGSRTTEQKLMGGIALIAGIIGGLKDGSNVGADKIEQAINQRFASKQKMLDEARRMRADLEPVWNEKQKDLDLQSAAAFDVMADKAAAQLKTLGASDAQIAGNAGIARLRKEAAERRAKVQEGLRREVEKEHSSTHVDIDGAAGMGGGRGGAPTEAQAKMAFLGQSMLDDLATIGGAKNISPEALRQVQANMGRLESLKKMDGGLVGTFVVSGARAAGLAPGSKYQGLPDDQARIANAIDNAVEKYTRLLTGAGMPVDEAVRMAQQAAPGAGDPPALVAQKLARLEADGRRMLALGGKAAGVVGQVQRQGVPAGAPAAPRMPQGAVAGTYTDPKSGKTYRGYRLGGKFVATE